MLHKKSAQSTSKVFISTLTFLSVSLLAGFASTVLADTLESNSYVIQFGNFNVTSGEKSSGNYSVTDTVGQTGAGPYGEFGNGSYFVGAGFQYLYPLDEFRFSISKLQISLGQLTAQAHNTDTNILTITAPTAGGYQIYAYAQHPLKLTNGTATIADTTCDAGDCDETAATVWQNQAVGGFGFTVDSLDAMADFLTPNHYRQFANNALSEPMQVIMSNPGYSVDRTATITYKAGLFGSEPSGNYETSIIYIAVPSY